MPTSEEREAELVESMDARHRCRVAYIDALAGVMARAGLTLVRDGDLEIQRSRVLGDASPADERLTAAQLEKALEEAKASHNALLFASSE